MDNQNERDMPDGNQNSMKLNRASVACRRCRRLRTKCVYKDDRAPCERCRRAGSEFADVCYFPARGYSHHDRGFRVEKSHKGRPSYSSPVSTSESQRNEKSISPALGIASPSLSAEDPYSIATKATWDVLPPHREIIEGCKVLWTSCFQVGFLPKRLFLEKLSQERESMHLFLILAILSVSCRFTPNLIKRYGSCQAASNHFIKYASSLVFDAAYEPTLENTQALFLLALAQWGNGEKIRSSINMGIAIRMAGILRLHREETYKLPKDAIADEIVHAEMARRTFWVIETQDNLHSSHASPGPFRPDDITALLPSDENDFAYGRIPLSRAALPGTKAAEQHPELISLPSRSLFATLLQAHSLWGSVARNAWRADFCEGPPPWDEHSKLARTCRTLADWERDIPKCHRWSVWNMRGHSAEQLHLAYLSVVLVTRLSNIVIRRTYLEDMLASITQSAPDRSPPQFWATVADELFENVLGLLEPINTFIKHRTQHEGFSAFLLFSLYVSGTLCVQLMKTPMLCPRLASTAKPNLTNALEILSDLQHAWPLASRWLTTLRKYAASMETRPWKDQISSPADTTNGAASLITNVNIDCDLASREDSQSPGNFEVPEVAISTNINKPSYEDAIGESLVSISGQISLPALDPNLSTFGNNELSFETELTEFLDHGNYGMMDVWIASEGL